jgi:hypothetical protein
VIIVNSDGNMLCPLCHREYTHIDLAHISSREEDGAFKEIQVNAITGEIDPWAEPGLGKVGRRQRPLLGLGSAAGVQRKGPDRGSELGKRGRAW